MFKGVTPVLKLTEYCNYDCCFCRYANHVKNTAMKIDIAKSIVEKVVIYNLDNGVPFIKILFHGGEPMLWGIDNFREIIKLEENLKKEKNIYFKNSIQTNGYLIDDDWIDFFKSNNFDVGISIDGPITLNEHYKQNNREESFQIVLDNIKKLKQNNIRYGILSVITKNHIGFEKDFFDFFVENEIRSIGLCYCYSSAKDESLNPKLLGKFLVELFNLYFKSSVRVNIREFDNAIQKLYNGTSGICSTSERKKCGKFITFDSCGDVFFCDEYNIDKENNLGNIIDNNITELLNSKNYLFLKKKSQGKNNKSCVNCSIKHLCGMGCARNDIDVGNYFCDAYKALYNHIELVASKYESKL